VSVAVRKLQGVESVEVSLQRAVADIKLRPGNTITLEQIRQLIKSNGFVSKEAVVTAIGTPRGGSRGLEIAVSGLTSILAVDSNRSAPAALQVMKGQSGLVELAGTVDANGASNQIAVSAAKPAQSR
jgi:copper chaperone CopZ